MWCASPQQHEDAEAFVVIGEGPSSEVEMDEIHGQERQSRQSARLVICYYWRSARI